MSPLTSLGTYLLVLIWYTAKFINETWSTFFTTWKLPSSNNLCKIPSQNLLPNLIWAGSLILLKIPDRQQVSFRGKGFLQIELLTRKCICLTKPLRTWFVIIFLMKQLFVMIRLTKVSKIQLMTKPCIHILSPKEK